MTPLAVPIAAIVNRLAARLWRPAPFSSMEEEMTLEVGQSLYFVPNRGQRRFITIESVGRKWAVIDSRLRINKDTLIADGGQYSSPGRCYLNEEAYRAKLQLDGAWSEFRQSIDRQYQPPAGMTIEKINLAKQALT